MEKKKKRGAGFVIALLAVAADLIKDAGGSGREILPYLFALAALLLGAYWLFTRRKGSSKAGPRPKRGTPPAAKESTVFPRRENVFKEYGSTSRKEVAEQWKSLYDAGLITKEEYRERLNRLSGQG